MTNNLEVSQKAYIFAACFSWY